MPIRFRRTFKIFPGVNINMSKGGISTTIGPRGFHLTFNRHGVRQSVGLPGSGLSESSYLLKNDEKKVRDTNGAKRERSESRRDEEADNVGYSPLGCLILFAIVVGLGYWAASALGWIPPHTLSGMFQQFSQWMQTKGF